MEGDILKAQIRERVKSEDVKCTNNGKVTMPCLIARDGDKALTSEGHCIGCGLNVKALNKTNNHSA